MDEYLPIDDLSTSAIKALLSTDMEQLDDDQILSIKDFVTRLGGMRNARLAIEMLSQLEDAG